MGTKMGTVHWGDPLDILRAKCVYTMWPAGWSCSSAPSVNITLEMHEHMFYVIVHIQCGGTASATQTP